jgi:hypothetical protein
MKIKKIYPFLFLFFLFSSLNAQTSSFDQWLSTSFKYDLTKKFELKVEIGHRRADFYSDRLYGDLVLKYEFNDLVQLGIGWRHAGETDPLDVDDLSDRFNLDFSGKLKKNDFSFKYRIRYQRKFTNWQTEQFGYIPNEKFRTRIMFGYDLHKNIDLDAGIETFQSISHVEPIFTDKVRYIVGFDYRINKRQDIGVHFIRQQEVQVANPHTSNIVAIDYSIDIKNTIKKYKKKIKKRKKKKAKAEAKKELNL